MPSNQKIRLRSLDPNLALNSPATESYPGCGRESVFLKYTFETLRQDEEFIVCRGRQRRQTDVSPPFDSRDDTCVGAPRIGKSQEDGT
jgi:hypothetical protein